MGFVVSQGPAAGKRIQGDAVGEGEALPSVVGDFQSWEM